MKLYYLLIFTFLFGVTSADYPCVSNYKANRCTVPCYIEGVTQGSESWIVDLNVCESRDSYVLKNIAALSVKEQGDIRKQLQRAVKKHTVCQLVHTFEGKGCISVLKLPSIKKKPCLFLLSNLAESESVLQTPIKRVQIFGERCSGTNFLQRLIDNNLDIPIGWCLGWKHFPISYENLLASKYLEKEREFLVIVIVRNLDDWLRSLHSMPHHAPKMRKYSFSEFLRAPWETEIIADLSEDGSFLDNVLALRAAKMKQFLSFKKHFSNFYFINYEVLKAYPEEVLADIASRYDIPCSPLFRYIRTYKGMEGTPNYKAKIYEPICREDQEYIQDNIDLEMEAVAGYY